MPRRPREELAGGIFHVFARGNDRCLIYRDDADRRMYLRMLEATVGQRRWRLLAFSLMENHVHLLVETPAPNLGAGIHRLHSLYAQEFNKRHGRSGHLFQGRYGATRVTTDEHFWTVAAYIAANPVRAGLCERPEDWRWSSHAAVIGGGAPQWLDIDRLLEFVGNAGGDPRARYTALVGEACSAMSSGALSGLHRRNGNPIERDR